MNKNPKRSKLGWVSEIRNQHFGWVFTKLLSYYIVFNLVFCILYYKFEVLKSGVSFFDYIYFSFVTSLSIGYGDLVPVNFAGKALVIIHSCFTATYFALMVSVLSIKLFYPGYSVKFSNKIIYNSDSDILIFRVINTNKEALINPEVRISVTEHNIGYAIAGVYQIPTDFAITYLGKHDFSYSFKNSFSSINVTEEASKALRHNEMVSSFESRFRIIISITGSYGLNQVAVYKKYYADDIIWGKSFKAITYFKQGYGKNGGLNYNKLKNFWHDFEKVE